MSANMVQYYRNGEGWELASLDEQETQAIHKLVRGRNCEVLKECLSDATEILNEYQSPYNVDLSLAIPLAQQLFERRALHIAVILDAVLRRKVFELRRNGAHANE